MFNGKKSAGSSAFNQGRGNLRKIGRIAAGAEHVKHHAQGVNIRLRCARTFRRWRHIAGRAHQRSLLVGRPDVGDESQVRQFGLAVYKNNVLRLDVAMRQPLAMIGTGAAGLREPAPTPTPYAREIQTSATVHGDLRPQPISREGPVPVPKSGGGIQPQAEGRLPQAPPGQVPLTPEARPGQMPPVEAGPPTGARGGPIPGAPPSQVSLTLALLVDGKPMTGGKDHMKSGII